MPKSNVPPHWNGLQISAKQRRSKREQLISHFRDAIRRGFVAKGTRLPSSRQLAADLGVSRQTVVAAYERLALEELVESRHGDGTYVAIDIGTVRKVKSSSRHRPSRLPDRARRILELPITPHLRANRGLLSPGVPALEEFPWATWRKASELLDRSGATDRLDRVESLGATHLRTAIAEYLAFTRGVLCDPEQIVVTSGAHNAIDLIARVVFDPGDEVWFEDPGYVAARATLVMNGAKVRPVPVDEEGLRVEDGLQLSPQARAAFVTPSHQYPLGVEMTKARRTQLLDWAEAHQAWIVENDFGSDFRYAGSPVSTLYRMGRENGDRVIYVGTFSNVLAPGLRLGFLVAPNELIEPIRRVRIFSDRQPPEPLQSQLAEFIAQGFLVDHLRRMNSIYQDRRDVVFEALQDRSCCSLDPGHRPNTGMHLVARLPRHDDALVSRKALEVGINVPALSGFFADPANGLRGLVIGFAGTPATRAKRAATALRSVIQRTDTIALI